MIYLEDVVAITRGYIDPPTTKMRATGEPALGLAISMREGGNMVDLGDQVNRVLADINLTVSVNRDLNGIVFLLNTCPVSKGRAIHWKTPHDRAVHQCCQQQENDQKDGVEHGRQIRTARPGRTRCR